MGLCLGGLIIGRIFESEIWGAYFREGLFFFGGGGEWALIEILWYVLGFTLLPIALFHFIAHITIPVTFTVAREGGGEGQAGTEGSELPVTSYNLYSQFNRL